MDNHFNKNRTLEVMEDDLPNQRLMSIRMKTLKSMATLLLHEMELLEYISPKTDDDNPFDNDDSSLPEKLERFEVELIHNALIETKGHQQKAANLLGIKMTTLNAKLKRHNIDSRTFCVINTGK